MRQRARHFSPEFTKATHSPSLSLGNWSFRYTKPNPPSRSPSRRSRYEPRYLSDDHGAVHRATEKRNGAVAKTLARRAEHRFAQALSRHQCALAGLGRVPIAVLAHLQTNPRSWRQHQEGL